MVPDQSKNLKIRVLRFGHKSDAQGLFASIRSERFDVTHLESISQVKFNLENDRDFAILLVDLRLGDEALDLLQWAHYHYPEAVRLAESSGHFLQSIQALNRGRVMSVLNSKMPVSDLELLLEEAYSKYSNVLKQKKVLRDVREKNQKLQALIMNQEQEVKDRTQHLADSKAQIEVQLRRMRSLTHFVQALSGFNSVDGLMVLLKKELKGFHKVKAPILAYMSSQKIPMISFFQGQQVNTKVATDRWQESARVRVNSVEDSQYLANIFGRPFAKVICIPISTNKPAAVSILSGSAILFIEHALAGEEIDEFLDFVFERLQSFAVAQDRVLLERELKNVSLLWEKTFDSLKEPIAIVDDEFQLVRSNRAFARKTKGRCFEQFLGREKKCEACPVPQVFPDLKPRRGRISDDAGVFEVYSYPIQQGSSDRVTSVINYYIDVTEADKLQRQVIQSEKMAAIGQLAGNIAHELNNPLTGLRSLAQVLLQEVDPSTSTFSDLKEIEQAANRCQSIIHNLLEFSGGEVEEKKAKVDFNYLVNRTLPLLKTAMRFFDCQVQLSKESGWVRVVPQLLQQVIFNIVNNACQAMEPGGTISIITQLRSKEVPGIELTIGDTGSGMSKEVMDKIFDPFFTTKEKGKGTGLGLSMSKDIVEKFGGTIYVESEIGRGSTFSIWLPLVLVEK